MNLLILLLLVLAGLGGFICFVIVVFQMFNNDDSTMGIICILLLLCTGVFGPLLAFIYGWIKAGEWQIQKLMLAWTGCLLLQFLLVAIGMATGLFEPTEFELSPEL